MSLEPQLKLTYSPKEEEEESPQLSLFSHPQSFEIPEYELDFLIHTDPEVAIWRRRTMLLASVFIHILLIILVAFSPELLRRGQIMLGIPVTPKKDQQVTTLFLPPDLLKSLRQPPPEAKLSDKNRQAQGRSPIIDPKGVHMPYSKGNTPEPEVRQGPPPAPTPAAPAPQQSAPQQQPPPPPPPRQEPPAEAQLHLDEVRPPNQSSSDMFRRSLSPGQAIQQSLQDAARGGYHPEAGSGAGGDSNAEFNNLHPNFSTEEPTILSDTRGVDFGPYLARIIMLVKRNWISILPESARLGEKGRVGVVFEILKDGSMPQERMVASSGSDPLDRAAFSSIHASAPFPPLPTEFTGEHLVLQFVFLYNEPPR